MTTDLLHPGAVGPTAEEVGDQADDPTPVGELLSPVLREVLSRVSDHASYARWQRQVAAAGYCSNPVRLTGSITAVQTTTGEANAVFDSTTEPDGVLLKACGNRRASRCRSCSAVYRADTWQLVAAGLRGGKGIPETVGRHPRLFVTFTAPSFGPVHSLRADSSGRPRLCRPRAAGDCGHGVAVGCRQRHDERDPLLGSPLCAHCYDYDAAVLWNALAPELWRRTTIYLHRALATRLGLSRAALARQVRLSFTKVAEYQARGLVHFHAVLRLDGVAGEAAALAPPPGCTAQLLAQVVRDTTPTVRCPLPGDGDRTVGWGAQLDVRIIDGASETANPTAIAAYVAKYATKSSTELGHALDTRLRSGAEIAALQVPEHVRRLVASCWRLGGRPELADLQLRRWAHMLGFRGHFSTRSRRYSTTLTVLRAARAEHRRARAGTDATKTSASSSVGDRGGEDDVPGGDSPDHPGEPDTIEVISRWRYAGRGYRTTGDALLAQASADRYWLAREEALLRRRCGPDRHPAMATT
jgi:hypothetical protein